MAVMDNYLTVYDVANIFKVSTRTIDRYVERGLIPPGVKSLGAKTRYWTLEEIEACLKKRHEKLRRAKGVANA